jgi:hypothetical protein
MAKTPSSIRELMLATGCCALYFAALPRLLAALATVLAFGFLMCWTIEPRMRGWLLYMMILSPIITLAVAWLGYRR